MHLTSWQRKFAGDECFERITNFVLTWKLKMKAEELVLLVQLCEPYLTSVPVGELLRFSRVENLQSVSEIYMIYMTENIDSNFLSALHPLHPIIVFQNFILMG